MPLRIAIVGATVSTSQRPYRILHRVWRAIPWCNHDQQGEARHCETTGETRGGHHRSWLSHRVENITSSAPGVLAFRLVIKPPNTMGIVYPTVSGVFRVVAPALITSPRILYKNSGSERPASWGLNSTSSQPRLGA